MYFCPWNVCNRAYFPAVYLISYSMFTCNVHVYYQMFRNMMHVHGLLSLFPGPERYMYILQYDEISQSVQVNFPH